MNYIDKTLLAGIIVLLQWHGISFWMDAAGPSGVLFSVLMEAVALFLWFHRIAWVLAGACSLVVILGPLYDVAGPVVGVMQSIEVDAKIAASYEAEIQIDTNAAGIDSAKNLTRLRASELARADAKKTLQDYRSGLRAATVSPGWLLMAQIIIQAAGLILLQWAQIIIIRRRPAKPSATMMQQIGIAPRRQAPVVTMMQKVVKLIAGGEFDGTPTVEAIQDKTGATIDDIKAAFKWLIANGYARVDGKKIVITKYGDIELAKIK